MIGRGGLTVTQYNQLLSGEGQVTRQVIAQRRNLSFDSGFETLDDGVEHFGVFSSGGNIYLANVVSGNLQVQVFDGAWGSPLVIGDASDVSPSFGAANYLFYVDSDGNVIRATTSDDWGTASTETYVERDDIGDVTHIAAVSYRTVYMARYYIGTTQFASCESSGVVKWSAIHWPHRLQGMDAIAVDDDDVIVASSDLPYQFGLEAEGTEVKTISIRRSGLVSFRVHEGIWSDHFLIEEFDESSAYQMHGYPRLTRLSGTGDLPSVVVCSVYVIDGDSDYHYGDVRLYFSSDGRYWSLGEPTGIVNEPGAALARDGNFAYLVTGSCVYRSYSTEITGLIAPNLQVDITDRILSIASSHSGIRSTTIDLDNSDDWLDSTILSGDGTFSVSIYLGLNGHNLKISHEIVDLIEVANKAPQKDLKIVSRDLGALLQQKRSPQARLEDSQILGADQFWDNTGTGFGGLRHTAAYKGSWSTRNGNLKLRSNNALGLAASTFGTRIWNGSVQSRIFVPTAGNDEFAGLVFRMYDKDNYFRVVYYEDDDKIQIEEIRGGEKSWVFTLLTSLGWAAGETHWIKVVYRYSRIYLYTSTDGRSWIYRTAKTLPGKQAQFYSVVAEIPLEAGSAGYVGYGYSEEDTWSWDNEEWEEPVYDDPVWGADPEFGVIYAADFSSLKRSYDFFTDDPSWSTVFSPPSGFSIRDFQLDRYNPSTIAQVAVLSSTEARIYRTTNLGASTPTWSLLQTIEGVFVSAHLQGALEGKWYLALAEDDKSIDVYYTSDHWSSINSTLNTGAWQGFGPYAGFGFAVSAYGTVLYTVYEDRVRLSTDGGENFGDAGTIPSSYYQATSLAMPWIGDETNQELYAGMEGTSRTIAGRLYKSTDQGSSFSLLTPTYGGKTWGPGYQSNRVMRPLWVNPLDKNYIAFIGGHHSDNQRLFVSEDGGDTWEHRYYFSGDISHRSLYNLFVWPFDPNYLWITGGSVLLFSDDGGYTWTEKQWSGFSGGVWCDPAWIT